MEEAKSVSNPTVQTPKPPNPTENLPPSQATPTVASRPPLHPQNKKRKVDNVEIQKQNSNYFKIRAIVRDLRPHFIEVLRTSDFRNSKAAHEIRKQMKLVMDCCKLMTVETVSMGKCNKPPEGRSLSGEIKHEQKSLEKHLSSESKHEQRPLEKHSSSESKHEQKPMEGQQEEKQGKQPHPDRVQEKSFEPPLVENNSEKKLVDDEIQATHVIGGSNLGWNFILYPGGKPVYCGVTKESRRKTK